MKRAQQFPGRTLRSHVSLRWVSSSPFPLPTEATTVRTKGYGPTKDLLKGLDTSKGLVVETVMHPADAEMQRRVLSLSSADVSVYTPLDVETGVEESSVATARREDIVAIAPDQLASVATVIVDQVKEQLELNNYVAEASHDGRSGSIVNAIATCLREEIDRVVLQTHTQEASFSRMLQDSSDLICARIASVIHEERPKSHAKDAKKDNQNFSILLQEVNLSMKKLEQSLKEAFESSITAKQEKDPIPEDLRVQIVTAIEQATRIQQENISFSLEEILEKKLTPQGPLPPNPPTLEEIENVVKTGMTRAMEDTQSEVRELIQSLREKMSSESTVSTSKDEARLEGLLASYGERLEEMRETSSGFSDLKELLMEVHSHQQTNMTAIHDIETQVKKLKKELINALHELAEGSSKSAKEDDRDDRFGEYCDKLDALADRVTSRVEEQLKQQHEDMKDLPTRLLELEKVIRERRQPVVEHVPSPQEFDDERMITLAQSISDSILATLAQREELSRKTVQLNSSTPAPTPTPTPAPVITPPVPQFTKDELAEAVSTVLRPKLEELAATIESKHKKDTTPLELDEFPTLVSDQQLVTVAQTISDSLRDMVEDVVAKATTTITTTITATATTTAATTNDTKITDLTHMEEYKESMLERLNDLKQSILATVQEEMGRTHEIDLTPFQNYLDEVIQGMKEEWNKKQELTENKIKSVVESLVMRLQEQHEQQHNQQREQREEQHQEQKHLLEKELQGLHKSNEELRSNSLTMEELTSITNRLLAEVKGVVSGETASVSSSLNTVCDKLREVTQQSSTDLSKKLSSIEASLDKSRVVDQENDLRVKKTLEEVTASLESVKEGNNWAEQKLSSLHSAVADMVHQSVTAASEMKAQLTASEERVGELNSQLSTELSQRFNQLQTEVLDGRQRIDELISSSADHKGMISAVEAMRVKLDTVGQILEDMAASKTLSPPVTQQEEQQEQKEKQQKQQQEQKEHVMNAILIEPQLESLSAATKEILSELQKLRHAQETLSSSESSPKLQQEQQEQPLPYVGVTKETLEAMEGRLSGRLDAVQSTLDSLKEIEASAALPLDETPEQVSETKDVKDRLAEIDALIKLAGASRGVHAKQIREKLVAIRSFIATAKFEEVEKRDMEEFIKVLESNRLKLKEDMVGIESELVEKVNERIQQIQDSLLLSLKQTVASSTESHVQQLQSDFDTKSNELKSHQEQLVMKLLDRINELEKSQGVSNAEMTEEMRQRQKEWRDALHHVLQQDVPTALRGTVTEVIADQLHTVQKQLSEQNTREEKSNATLLSSIQQVSQDLSQLNGFGGEVRAAVSGGSAQVIEELRRTHEGLAERIERHVKEVVHQRGTVETQPSVSHVAVAETTVEHTPHTSAAVMYSARLPMWWLVALSFVLITTIMAALYFLSAVFLVMFVPVPPPEELLLSSSTSPTPQNNTPAKRLTRSRVVDEVIQ
ncbi:uncharacterized protein TM35_000401750 [Trypanosoma theileri]|uniref:Protein p166 n=1 Tax=Trypanosoma theileri TaxID=67003 RepID=A0A1X0NK67_9TRYP|nr:uncharacterized protein TM35_000401750 [Trypanosoma theileri]ORC84908.1 hypothetical protein TM35_000401750 [Trypanosoma theileri]